MTTPGYALSLVIGALIIAGTIISLMGPPRTRRLGLIGGTACVIGFFVTRLVDWFQITGSLDTVLTAVGGVVGIVGLGALALAAMLPAPDPVTSSDEKAQMRAYQEPCHRRIPCPQKTTA